MAKTALVLEGGGMRGAYTAGCMSWLLKNGIEFDTAYGISTGAIHMCSFLCKSEDYLYDLSTNHIADKALVGVRPLLREGHLVGYNHLFNYILPELKHYDINLAKSNPCDAKFGVYDIDKGATEFIRVKDSDDEMLELKGACTLPILGRVVKVGDRKLLDGGITKMIPIEESVKDGNDYHLVITTKPADFVRKPATKSIKLLMRTLYPKHPNIERDYAIRHLNYQTQIDLIKELEKEDKAIYIYPSKNIPVSRLSGDKESLRLLYQLGIDDMESNKEKIFKVFNR